MVAEEGVKVIGEGYKVRKVQVGRWGEEVARAIGMDEGGISGEGDTVAGQVTME